MGGSRDQGGRGRAAIASVATAASPAPEPPPDPTCASIAPPSVLDEQGPHAHAPPEQVQEVHVLPPPGIPPALPQVVLPVHGAPLGPQLDTPPSLEGPGPVPLVQGPQDQAPDMHVHSVHAPPVAPLRQLMVPTQDVPSGPQLPVVPPPALPSPLPTPPSPALRVRQGQAGSEQSQPTSGG